MGFPVAGCEGTLTSWGTGGNFYATLLAGMKAMSAGLVVSKDFEDTTGLGQTAQRVTDLLKSWEVLARGYAKSTPVAGNVGVVTVNSGSMYSTHAEAFSLTLESKAVHDITALNVNDSLSGGIPYWKRFRPDYSRWSATIEARVDSSTNLTMPADAGGTLVNVTLTYASSATLTGDAIVKRATPTIERGALTRVTYEVEGAGALTPAGAGSILGSTAFGVPLWSEGGSAVGAIVLTPYSGETWTGTDSFWRRIMIRCAVNSPVMIECDIQGSQAMTVA